MSHVALVTGSSSGIGHGIAKQFAQAGYHVAISGVESAADAEKALQSVQSAATMSQIPDQKIIYVQANLMSAEPIAALIQTVESNLGTIDILVNNAGIQHVSPLEDFPPEKWDAVLALNLTAAFHTTRLVIPSMKQKKWGRIINIASAHALVASPFKAAYVAAKHGIAGLTKVTALEVAQYGITCNAVCPGYVDTPLVRGQIDSTAKARGITPEAVVTDVLLAAQPTKKFVRIEEVAAFTEFLCTDAGQSITGSILSIDGGWTAH